MLVLVFVFVSVLVFVLVLFLLGFFGCVRDLGFGEAGDVVVASLPDEAVEVPGEAVAAAVEAQGTAGAVAVVRAEQRDPTVDVLGGLLRNAAGLDVHHAANGAAAIQQRARAFEDLHALGQERLDGHGVVAAAGGDVHGVDAVFHHAHSGPGQAVYHRPADGRAEIRIVDARLAAEGGADAGRHGLLQLLVGENRDGFRQPLAGERVGGNHHLLDSVGLVIGLGLGCRGQRQRREGREVAQAQGASAACARSAQGVNSHRALQLVRKGHDCAWGSRALVAHQSESGGPRGRC